MASSRVASLRYDAPSDCPVKLDISEDSAVSQSRSLDAGCCPNPWIATAPVFATQALCHFIGSCLGLTQLLGLRALFKGMPRAVDHALASIFEECFPGIPINTMPVVTRLLDDFREAFVHQLGKEEQGGKAAIRLVVSDSPGRLELEIFGSASWQADGYIWLFGEELCTLNIDTVGLYFLNRSDPAGPGADRRLNLREGNNLTKSAERRVARSGGSARSGNARVGAVGEFAPEIIALGEKFRQPLDPKKVTDVLQLMNPSTLATILQLFPDGKYDVALLQDTFVPYDDSAPYATGMTNWLHEIRGKTGLCYLSSPADGKFIPGNLNHLLKTQASLDPEQLNFYTQQLQTLTKTATSATAGPRPTALVFDFFNEGHINAVRFDEDDAQRVTGTAPGSRATVTRRRQRRAAEAAEPTYQERKMKTWILLDGHHKVEAAAQLGCSLNFLVVSPCAEPYAPLGPEDAPYVTPVTSQVSFPHLLRKDTQGPLKADWEAARLCRHCSMLLSSSKEPPEACLISLGCPCFQQDSFLPRWAYEILAWNKGAVEGCKLLRKLQEYWGKDHEVFTQYFDVDFQELPQAVCDQCYEDPFFRHLDQQ